MLKINTKSCIQKYLWFSLTIFFLAGIFSCEESSEPQVEVGNIYFPSKVGNYWIYDSYQIGIYGQVIDSTKTIDSVILKEIINDNGVRYLFQRFKNGFLTDTIYYYFHDNKIYQSFNKDIYIPEFTFEYLPVMDFGLRLGNSWNLLIRNFDNYPMTVDGKEYDGNYRHTINGTYEILDSTNFDNKMFASKVFSNKYDSKLEISISIKKYNNDGSYKIDSVKYFQILKYFDWYRVAEGIGLTQIRRDAHSLKIYTEPSSTISSTTDYNGNESLLIRYGKVK